MSPATGDAVRIIPGHAVHGHAAALMGQTAPQLATGAPAVQLPADEAAHHAPVEWWYFNGHLAGTDAAGHLHCYGFEYVTFQFLGLGPAPLYVANFAITDLDRKTFSYQARNASQPAPTKKDGFALHTANWSMSGGSGTDVLNAALPNYSLDLRLQSTEPAVLEGDDGIVSEGAMGTSAYYSWTSLIARGTLVDHGVPIKVVGISWMDHQWGAVDLEGGGGWDWFSVQLSNGDQYLLAFIRNSTGRIVSNFGTRVIPTGQAEHMQGTLTEQGLGSWHSAASGFTYGSGWHLTLPGGTLTVTPDLRDQELDFRSTTGNVYWEGDVSVAGRLDGSNVAGVGYTELNPPGGF